MLKRKASLSTVSQDPKKEKTSLSSKDNPSDGKDKEEVTISEASKWMSVDIKLPSDFLMKDELNSDIFPHVNSLCLPIFRDRYKDMSIDDLDAHSVGLALRSFQASLLLHSKMEEVKKLSTISVKKMEEAEAAKRLAEVKLEAKEAEIQELKAQLLNLRSRIQEVETSASVFKLALTEKEEEVQKLKMLTETTTCQRVINREEELEQLETYVCLKTRAQIMLQHLLKEDPLKDAVKVVETFVKEVGTIDDLKFNDGDLRLFLN